MLRVLIGILFLCTIAGADGGGQALIGLAIGGLFIWWGIRGISYAIYLENNLDKLQEQEDRQIERLHIESLKRKIRLEEKAKNELDKENAEKKQKYNYEFNTSLVKDQQSLVEKPKLEEKEKIISLLKKGVEQYGEFETCCLCFNSKTRNKVETKSICNTCLKQFRC